LSRSIAKFDIYWAITIFWEVRNKLSEQERPWEDGAGYRSAPWPDEPLGWLRLLLGVPWSDWQQYPTVVNDAQLMEAIDRFIPSVKNAEDREALHLYRCGAEVRFCDRVAAHRTATSLVLPKYRAYAFARLIRMLTPNER